MKKLPYILSMVGYVMALVADTVLYFNGYYIFGVLSYFILSTILYNACLFTFASLSYFKSSKFIYILRSFLFVNIISSFILALIDRSVITIPILTLNIILIVLTFFEKEKAVTKEEKKDKAISNILFFTLVPIVIGYCTSILAIPFGIIDGIVCKNDYYKEHSYTTEKATKEQSEEIFNEINRGTYSYLKPYWYMVDLDSRTTAKLKDFDLENEYWIIDNNEQLIMKTEYDYWDNYVSKDIKVKNDFVYPNTYEDKVANVYLYYGDNVDTLDMTAKLQLNESQIQELYDVAFFGVPEEDSDKLVNKKEEGLKTISEYYIFWEFENAEKLVYQEGRLIEIADGKYVLNYENPDGYNYIIPDKINEIIENAVSIYDYE